jgi:hypothetical protein
MSYAISPSSLVIYSECKRCFWDHYHGKKRPMGITPSLPNGIDLVMKNYYDAHNDASTLPPELAAEGLTLFPDRALLKTWQNNRKGLRAEFDGGVLRGAVDYIVQQGKLLIALDFKTRGFPLRQDCVDRYQNSLDLYTLLLQKNGYQTANHSYLLYLYPLSAHGEGKKLPQAKISNEHAVSKLQVDFAASLIKCPVSAQNGQLLVDEALALLHGSHPHGDCEYCSTDPIKKAA